MSTTTTAGPLRLLEQARAAMGVESVENALRIVDDRAAAVRGSLSADSEHVRALVADVVSTLHVPTDLGAQIVASRRANEESAAEAEVLTVAQTRLVAELQRVHRQNADAGLAVLADELARITTSAREVFAQMGPQVHDPITAIEHDQASGWRQVTLLAGQHLEVREAQRIVTTAALTTTARPDEISDAARDAVDLVGHVRDAGTHVDLVAQANAMRRRHMPTRTTGLMSNDQRPLDDVALPWLALDPVQALRFLVGPDLSPWVPSIAQLRAARATLDEAVKARRAEDATAEEAAEAEYWKERGQEPATGGPAARRNMLQRVRPRVG